MNKKILAIIFVVLAALLYAINIPFSKLLLNIISPTMLVSQLYLGAGLGIGLLFLLTKQKNTINLKNILIKMYLMLLE